MIEVIPNPEEEQEQILSKMRDIKDYFSDIKCHECRFLGECAMYFKGCPGDWEI